MAARDRTESKIKYEPATEEDQLKTGNCCARTKSWFTQFPRATWPILVTEFGERFSYYGIKTVLVLYLTKDLMFNKADGKTIYHAFSMTSYFTGVIGAMIADSFLGKYRTIAYTLFVYSLSEMLLTATSADTIGNRSSIGPLIALFLMAIACGNIKPCLAAFGGDQFRADQEHLLDLFFAMFYASVNVGAVLCMYFIPIVRTDVQCYGRDCYPAVFGINTVLIIVAFLAFIGGKRMYTLKDPAGNVFIKVIKIVGHALGNKISGSGPPNTTHWLDNALDTYEQKEVNDVRMLLRVLVMYIPLPVFWALFHQQGSSWTLQAEQMDGDLGPLGTLRSDQIQALNPILVLILIPLYDAVIYPMFERCQFPLSPLKRMTGGLGLAGVAFVICAFVQIKIQTVGVGPSIPSSGHTSVQFINTIPCDVSINPTSFFRVDLKYGERSQVYEGQFGMNSFRITTMSCNITEDTVTKILEDQTVVSAVIGFNDKNEPTMSQHTMKLPGVDIETAVSRVRILYTSNDKMTEQVDIKLDNVIDDKKSTVLKNMSSSTDKYQDIPTGEYVISELIGRKGNTSTVYKPKSSKRLKLANFGAFTLVISPSKDGKFDVHIFEDAPGTSVSRLWQVPQYIVLTAAEVMFSVTGLGFAYSQAPASMKSVLQSFWLLTVAFGDLIVVILSSAKPVRGVEKEMFLYGGLMGVIMIIFGIMSYFYKYVTLEEVSASEHVLSHEPNGEIPLEEKFSDHEDTKI
ncbi:solute carrier family 15 member 2-like isoform X2 [Actinia tenebrosa]|uniref:Solute carrier family 15 member 2-like isoform X2 n=1 Tax=Actinia tenebrosa TaxID=6105 RepID=A0A6P8IEP7_ACTTE|nr:solute carrier family 15 member 2-like isoform X2 [Actinia tenebrosa]